MVFNVRRPFQRSNTSEAVSDEASNPSKDDIKTSNELPGKANVQTNAFKVSGAEIESELADFRELHQWDPNLPESIQNQVDSALKTHDIEREVALDHELNQENSIYPEGMLGTLSVLNWTPPYGRSCLVYKKLYTRNGNHIFAGDS